MGDTLVRIPDPSLLDGAGWKGGHPGEDRPPFICVWVTTSLTPSMAPQRPPNKVAAPPDWVVLTASLGPCPLPALSHSDA